MRRPAPRTKAAALAAPFLLLLAGCGGGAGAQAPAAAGVTPQVTTNPAASFAASCGSCHTLADAGTTGTAGPNLDEVKPALTAQDVVHAVDEGPGAMPPNLLPYRDTAVVARYVASVAGRR